MPGGEEEEEEEGISIKHKGIGWTQCNDRGELAISYK